MSGTRSTLLLWLCLLPLVALANAPAAAPHEESLNFRVYYQGLLSGMTRVAIADASLQSRWSGQLQVSTLHLSSAAHGLVDSLYPIRYRLRSLYAAESQQLLGFERFKKGRKFKHDLAWVDGQQGRVHYLRAAAGPPADALPPALRPWLSDTPFRAAEREPLQAMPGVLDRLTLLQALRRQWPSPQQPLTLALTDGRKQYRYQVEWQGRETLTLAGSEREAVHLRVRGAEIEPATGAVLEASHPPIDVWLGAGPQRLPLRLQIDHSVGVFTVEWSEATTPVQVAITPPPESQVVAVWE
jgi:hypothetical protein